MATLALAAEVAHAQQPAAGGSSKEQAARLAAEAESYGKKQQFADALRNYKRAAELDPATAAYQCNIGMAYYALGDEARAHLYFGRCYKANRGWPANVEDVFNYVVGVLGKEEFTPLKIQGTPANAEVLITLYAEEGPVIAPATVYVPYSNYQIEVRAEGYESAMIPVEANTRAEKTVTYKLERAATSGDTTGEPAGPSAATPVSSGGEVGTRVDSGGGRKKWPLALAAGGVVAGVGGYFARQSAKD
ncbi:MAG TPA: tetratricopeptide repeat protein, partial [Kofleriaceae bacterium]|nr:tetratricopeptide repeat protein [Kofleriaceae bacterium]